MSEQQGIGDGSREVCPELAESKVGHHRLSREAASEDGIVQMGAWRRLVRGR